MATKLSEEMQELSERVSMLKGVDSDKLSEEDVEFWFSIKGRLVADIAILNSKLDNILIKKLGERRNVK